MTNPERSYTQDMDGVYYALQDLAHVGGGSLTAIGAHLFNLGVRGERKTSFHCPIANWLRLTFGADCDPEVEEDAIRVHAFEDTEPGAWIDPPDAITDFINAIDSGGYSDLIEEASNA